MLTTRPPSPWSYCLLLPHVNPSVPISWSFLAETDLLALLEYVISPFLSSKNTGSRQPIRREFERRLSRRPISAQWHHSWFFQNVLYNTWKEILYIISSSTRLQNCTRLFILQFSDTSRYQSLFHSNFLALTLSNSFFRTGREEKVERAEIN